MTSSGVAVKKRFDGGAGIASDSAALTIDLSQWTVQRDTGERAIASADSGCTISELAEEIGLTASEFEEWLTKDDEANYELLNGQSVRGSELTINNVLAATSNFQVPNVIYLAWLGDCGWDGDWKENFEQSALQVSGGLGFGRLEFDNDLQATPGWFEGEEGYGRQAKEDFVYKLEILAEAKALHGLYIVGNGIGTEQIGVGSNSNGPEWTINYGGNINSNSRPDYNNIDSVCISDALNYKLGALIIHAYNSRGGF